MKLKTLSFAILALAAGCAGYTWKSQVPEEGRSVFVPVFRNDSEITELGDVMAKQLLREFQREGTFRIARADDAAYEIQGTVVSVVGGGTVRGRQAFNGVTNGRLRGLVKITVVDRRKGAVVVNDRPYECETDFLVSDDMLTAKRDASGRLAEDAARRIVDDMASGRFAPDAAKEVE